MTDTQKVDEEPLGTRIDQLFKLREERLAKAKEVEELKKIETNTVKAIMTTLEDSGMSKATGKLATFALKEMTVPKVVDFDKLSRYIIDTGYVHLLGRNVSAPAFRELVELEGEVPGVEPYTFSKHSLTRSSK